jgi:hypothetical protein
MYRCGVSFSVDKPGVEKIRVQGNKVDVVAFFVMYLIRLTGIFYISKNKKNTKI